MKQSIGVVLYESEAENCLAQWVADDVLRKGMSEQIQEVLYVAVPDTSKDSDAFLTVGSAALEQYLSGHPIAPTEASSMVFLLIAVFWDGRSEASKEAFRRLKRLTDEKGDHYNRLLRSVATPTVDESSSTAAKRNVKVLLQALGAKKGNHTMKDNQEALVNTLCSKLATSSPPTKVGPCNGPPPSSEVTATRHHDPEASSLVIGEADISSAAVTTAVDNGQGECFFAISAPTLPLFEERLQELQANCMSAEVDCMAVMSEPRKVDARSTPSGISPPPINNSNAGVSAQTVYAQEMLLRRHPHGSPMEMRIVMCGNVDSGKSTLTSVLTRGCRDDGRGRARAFVFNHRHEALSGRTSSVSENYLGFSSMGEVVNYSYSKQGNVKKVAVGNSIDAPASNTAHAGGRQCTTRELMLHSAKILTLYDLAGHEKYLKTTVLGMTRNMPDYACIVVSANNGIQRMTKEHLVLCLALKIPFFVVITRIDSTPSNVRKDTLDHVHKMLKSPSVRKLPYPVRGEELVLAAKNLRHDRMAPIFEVSNVTGEGIDTLLCFMNLLPKTKDWRSACALPKQLVIDKTYFVTGIGTIVGGLVTQGIFRPNDTVLLGPDGLGHYRSTVIKSIHVKGMEVEEVSAGQDATVCLKKEKRNAIRKGNILIDPRHPPKSYWQLEAEITVLYHSTTISVNYEPVIHSITVRQSARITYVAKEVLRTGDRSLVRFHFLYRPEFAQPGQRLVFREGRTKGIGVISQVIEAPDEELLRSSKVRCRAMRQAVPVGSSVATGGQ